MSRDQALLDVVFNRLAETEASDQLAEVVLGAYAGDEELRAVLAGEDARLPRRSDTTEVRENVYLDRVTVAGFRGIGPKATLHLQPQNGLTLVVGRNGSGKSSFAEAIELALTGDSQRWAERNSIFRDGWRNLHTSAPCEIDLSVRLDGVAAPLRIRRSWSAEATDPDQADISQPDAEALGWRQPMLTYRPFLTANDLGRLMSSRPSELFDAMAPLLAIEPVTDAETRLKNVRKVYDDRAKAVRAGRTVMRSALEEVDDDIFADDYGFVVDYIAEVLKSMRSQDYSDRYQRHFTLSPDISTRDRDGIHKTFSGLMKILYPDGEATREEIEEILRYGPSRWRHVERCS